MVAARERCQKTSDEVVYCALLALQRAFVFLGRVVVLPACCKCVVR